MLQNVNQFFQTEGAAYAELFSTFLRFFAPALAVWILWRCAKPLVRFRKEPETWAWMVLPDGTQIPVTHWENIIGRSKGCDIVIDFATVSRNHAVLTRYDDGSWSLTEIGARGAMTVNDAPTKICALNYGDVISLGGVEMMLAPITAEELEEQKRSRTRPATMVLPAVSLLLLTMLQLLIGLQFWMRTKPEAVTDVVLAFGLLVGLEWLLFFSLKLMHRSSFEVETLAFYLCTLGLSVVAARVPSEIMKQLVCMAAGVVIYLMIGWSMRELQRAKRVRYLAAIGGILLLAINLLVGKEINGAKNWIQIGSLSFQPSELVKLCFIFVGASTMDRIVTKRNLFSFIIYSAVICGSLALMNDFGTALIFFVALLVICLLRGGSFATLALVATVVVCAALMLLFIDLPPHVLRRFSVWGHAWDDPSNLGYQQVRAMMCLASGGLFGLGAGNGWLKYVAAADTDLVFAFVGEEWGLLIALTMVLAIIIIGFFVFRSCSVGRSSFYTIGACTAAAILLTQTILNVFGTMDLLPLTGVTFPFVSNGGSSMLCVWGLLAFVKAADTRQNASFAVRNIRSEEVELYE